MSEEKKKHDAPTGEKKPKQQSPKQAKGEKPAAAPKGEKKPKAPAQPAPPPRLRDKFKQEVCPKIKTEFGLANPMALPRVDKVKVTVGLGKSLEGSKINAKAKEQVLKDLTAITGQKPVMCKAKKSVANFKLRAGYEIGAMVTLRGARMWEFLDRLIALAIPRIKDFRGLNPKAFDGRGNYSFGVTEQGIFPEINMAEAEFTHGMNIQVVFKNSTNDRSLFVLKELGVPFTRPEDQPGAKRN